MWKDYSWGYIKNNRASGISVMVAAFISALLLSLLCSLFYNFWKYDVERIRLEEGDWQARLTGVLEAEDITAIEAQENVEKVAVHEEVTDHGEVVLDIYLNSVSTIFTDMPRIAEAAGLPGEAITYHHSLLSMYLIRDPKDPAPRLVFPFFLAVLILACVSLIMIIHNSFAVSMNTRIHQFGIFSSIGATPRQIRTCLLQEAAALCAVPVAAGSLLGIWISMGILKLTNVIAGNVQGRHKAVWGYHPLALAVTAGASVLTVWISAWLPAGKLGRLTPLEAIRDSGELHLKKKKHSRILAFLFGVEGELAGNAWRAQRKALRTASVSLIFSFLAFTLMQCFFTLTVISQRMTYFEKYQDAWDMMITVKNTALDSFEDTEELQSISGVESCVVYQKATAGRIITEEELSDDVSAADWLPDAPEAYVTGLREGWLVNAPLVILDDTSFLMYCRQIGAKPRLDGAVILNRIRDASDPDFRNPVYVPYLKEDRTGSILCQSGDERSNAEIPVLFYTQNAPLLREEYATIDHYELVHFFPESLWRQVKEQIGGAEEDLYVRILADGNPSLEELTVLQKKAEQIIGQKYETEMENRIEDKIINDNMIHGMMLILGGFCVLLAVIGIACVFSNTLGAVRQRRRELARYLSVGLTPGGLKKMFFIEALVIAGRPVLITLPLTAVVAGLMLKMSYLEPMIFIREAPVIPILAFMLAIFGFVALAYYLGWRQVRRMSLADALRDDTLY